MTERQRLCTTKIEQDISIDIQNKVALSTTRIGEGKDIVSILIGVNIRGGEYVFVPPTCNVSAQALSFG